MLKQRMDLVAESGLSMAEVDAMTPEGLAHWLEWLQIRKQERIAEIAMGMAGVGARRKGG